MDVWFATHLGDARLLSAIRCTFLRRYGRFQLTWHIAWSLGDSWASFPLLIQDWLVWIWFLHVVVRLLRMFIDALFVMTVFRQSKVYLVYMDSVCMLLSMQWAAFASSTFKTCIVSGIYTLLGTWYKNYLSLVKGPDFKNFLHKCFCDIKATQ